MTNKKLIENNDHKKLIFILGAPRSGSTLLLSFLCGIPNTKILYETRYLTSNYLGDDRSLISTRLKHIADYFDHFEEEIVIEKTPEHVFHLEDIEKLRELCKRDIYVVYIIRPPVPTVLSLIKASKDSPELFGNIDLLGACEKYEESLVYIYNNLILKTNQSNYPLVKIPIYGKDFSNNTVKIDSYEDRRLIPYSFCISYRELIENSYKVLSNLLNSLYIEADIQSLIDNRISNTRKYLSQVINESHHKNVLRDIEEVEIERRAKIEKQISEGFSDKYIERSNYIRNYFEHPTTKETIYDLVVTKKVLVERQERAIYTPLVTIVVPLYNKEKYIRDTLNSLINQTYKNLQIVVIDDASNDKSLEIVNNYLESLPEPLRYKLLVIEGSVNRGVSFTRNIGLAIKTDIISFCDADDTWDKELVQKSVDTFTKYPYVDCVYSRVLHKRGDVLEKDYNKICNGNVFKDSIKYNFLTCGSNIFIKKEVIDKNNIEFNLAYSGCEDWDFLIQLSKVAVFKCTKEYLVTYRRLYDSLSSNKKNQVDMGKDILNRYIEDKKEFSRLFTRLFLFYLSLKNLTWRNIKDLDFRFILETILDKFKSYVKSYLS